MSTSTNESEQIAHLQKVISRMNVYFGSLIFVIGIIGNIVNILILCRRSLRSNICIVIFVLYSISGTITIISGLSGRIMSNWNFDIANNIRWLCKFRALIIFTFRMITFWLIMLGTIDRWIVSHRNARWRHLSSKRNLFRSILLITILSIIIHAQLLYCYESNLSNAPLKCFNKDKKCRLINDLIFGIITILTPIIVIVVFGWMIILNIHSSATRLEPVRTISKGNTFLERIKERRLKRKEKSVLKMLFVQVILFGCLTLPMTINKLYTTLTMNVIKSPLQMTKERFIYHVALLLTFVASGMQFYLNILSGGRVFRKALIDLFRTIIRKIIRR